MNIYNHIELVSLYHINNFEIQVIKPFDIENFSKESVRFGEFLDPAGLNEKLSSMPVVTKIFSTIWRILIIDIIENNPLANLTF